MTAIVEKPVSYIPRLEEYKLIDKIKNHIKSNDKFFSLEFFPPRTPHGVFNLFEKFDQLSKGQPLFCDMSWNIVKHDSEEKQSFVDIASYAQEIMNCDAMIQLNATILNEERVTVILDKAKKNGLHTVMVLEESSGGKSEDFENSVDLIRFIRYKYGQYFSVCVAGYPYCVDNSNSIEDSIVYLFEQVNAGADFIITHMVFQAVEFLNFVKICRKVGINTPIIPGIMPIQTYGSLHQLTRYSRIKIPEKVLNVLKPIKNNDATVLKYGTFLTVELCKILLQNVSCCGLHFFTLNQEKATMNVLKEIGLWNEIPRPSLPWHSNGLCIREGEEVRPIFWSCRPGSYHHRTSDWQEFPNGRWGDSSKASFGSFYDYHLFYVKNEPLKNELKKMWHDKITSLDDICDVFVSYLSESKNSQGYEVTNIPWSEEDIAMETRVISDHLIKINKEGILTINSQPNVSCAPSTHKIFGWGDPGGFVFQKAYLEFFCSPEDKNNLLKVLQEYSSVNYHLVNCNGHENFSNADLFTSNAVTWGVFTGKMVLQPTVVDPVAFQYWKDEAFDLWLNQWGKLYDEDSDSFAWIKTCHDTFYLCNLVDNDYVKGNCLFEIVNRVIEMRTRIV